MEKNHKKRILALLLLSAVCLAAVACASNNGGEENSTTTETPTTTEPPTEAPETPEDKGPETLDKTKSYKILFIGNSHTYKNDMPSKIFTEIVKSAGYNNVTVKSATTGGKSLKNHLAGTTTIREGIVIKDEIESGSYDFIVLQEKLVTPITNYNEFKSSVSSFVNMAKAANPNVKIFLYNVWGSLPQGGGSDKLSEAGCKTTNEMTWKLAAAHKTLGEELGLTVAYSGLSFMKVTDQYPNNAQLTMYEDDGYHPAYLGSYISALTLFSTIFQCDPTTVTWNGNPDQAEEKDEALINYLKAQVKDVVFNTPEIDAKYYAAD